MGERGAKSKQLFARWPSCERERQMYPGVTIANVFRVINLRMLADIVRSYGSNKEYKAMVGLLLARPECKIAKDDIIPNLSYYDARSAENVDLFLMGYTDVLKNGARKLTLSVADKEWFFDDVLFDEARGELEHRSKWRYSGEADLLLANVEQISSDAGYHVNFGKVLCFDLDMMLRDKAIESVPRFLEEIFRFAESSMGPDPVSSFSNKKGLKVAGSSALNSAMDYLRKLIFIDVKPLPHFSVRNITR